jgi:uncharacterized protein with von Willebrand factor type A (vWA) domain
VTSRWLTGSPADLATLAARFAEALRRAGLLVGPDRAERFARAVCTVEPVSVRQLYWCALATMTSDPAQREILDPVFGAVFEGLVDPAEFRGQREPPLPAAEPAAPTAPADHPAAPETTGRSAAEASFRPSAGSATDHSAHVPSRALAVAEERLASRDFGELSAAELAELRVAMARFRLVTPLRVTRRSRPGQGRTVDLRDTLRAARRTGGDPAALARRRPRHRPRRLVVLCDISGSMEPYARALLQLVYSATGGGGAHTGAEVFTFATRLTRLTHALARTRPSAALVKAGHIAPDWSGGTRIGAAVKDFLDGYGQRGMARGAVVLIISDGWETGDPALLGTQMARLRRLAHRVVWANPRTRHADYRPLVGGMAAAWPYCDAVVSAHRLSAIDDLLDALCDGGARRSR